MCWVRGNSSDGPGHIVSLCVSAVWSAGPVQFLSGHFLGADCGTVQIFPFSLWLCCSGYSTVEMASGVVRVSFHFLQSVVSSSGGRISVVGFLCYINRFSLVDLWYFFVVSYFRGC